MKDKLSLDVCHCPQRLNFIEVVSIIILSLFFILNSVVQRLLLWMLDCLHLDVTDVLFAFLSSSLSQLLKVTTKLAWDSRRHFLSYFTFLLWGKPKRRVNYGESIPAENDGGHHHKSHSPYATLYNLSLNLWTAITHISAEFLSLFHFHLGSLKANKQMESSHASFASWIFSLLPPVASLLSTFV